MSPDGEVIKQTQLCENQLNKEYMIRLRKEFDMNPLQNIN